MTGPVPRPTRLERRLGVTLPLLQAGMGGVAGPELCGAVSRAGAGGVLGLYKEPPEQVRRLIADTAARTDRPFGINLVPEVLAPDRCRAQLDAALGVLPERAFVTFYGLPAPDLPAAVVRAGLPVVVQVGTTHAAGRALDAGADVVVLQGVEAGGHLLGALPALPLLRAVRRDHPDAVLAVAGGIATGADLARAVAEGADGAMVGTLFAAARESEAHPEFKRRIVAAGASDTVVTTVFDIGWPNRPHRVLRNALTAPGPRRSARFIATATAPGGRRLPVPRYSAVVPSVRTEGRIEDMAMYCGDSCERITATESAADLVERIRADYGRALHETRPERADHAGHVDHVDHEGECHGE
ncbi:NAD(P)H-dependent flavin oxidoreductase [Kitasatospora sp. CB01950]|uniref:NAD(P)H-dependent flavin oxidoreductase n=1 Tax=Kitasatospora sp. CB01950 TaxID=1703930 RepID=UPI00093F2929|nr:nitronate monooxygenase [Kitasatospora sp. CB01950]